MSRLFHSKRAVAACGATALTAGFLLVLASFGGASTQTLGAQLQVNGTFQDDGRTYTVAWFAQESSTELGNGITDIDVDGNRMQLCSVHVSPGNCGTASNQAVSIEGCKALVEAHGLVHSDFPLPAIYLGDMTVEAAFKKQGANTGSIKLTIYTPKKEIVVSGTVTGFVSMSTCP
jgi:hypothetical protein